MERYQQDSNQENIEYQKPIKLDDTDLIDDLIDDLVDEDDLLSSYDLLMSGLTKPNKITKKDCQKSRRACKNCSCGRADKSTENKSKTSKTSMCGNCHLGDGFRCDTCPSKGLSPFSLDQLD